MNDKNKGPANMLKRPVRRRSILKGALAGTTLLAGSGIFAPRIITRGRRFDHHRQFPGQRHGAVP